MVKGISLKFRQEKEEVRREGGVVRCSFHVFVAYRVYSPIRFAVSMGTRGKTYRFSLSTPLKEENSFKNPLAPFSHRFSHPFSGISFVSSFRLFLPFHSVGLSSPEKKGERKKQKEQKRRNEGGGEEKKKGATRR